MIECNKDCSKCKQLNGRTDDKGYPFGYECMKYGDSVFAEQFGDTKVFKTAEDYERGLWKRINVVWVNIGIYLKKRMMKN